MPDKNGLSLWAEREDKAFHLKATLQAFERSYFGYKKDPTVFPLTEQWMQHQDLLHNNNISSVEQLALKCRSQQQELQQLQLQKNQQQTNHNKKHIINNNTNNNKVSLWKDGDILRSLCAFLPSPVGFQCYRLAEDAVLRVESGLALASYVHRGSKKGEKWVITTTSTTTTTTSNDICWTLDVDCAGYVRNVLKSVTGSEFLVCLSDRDYMRAKDFYTYFERLEFSVKDVLRINPAEEEGGGRDGDVDDGDDANPLKRLKWCRVDDLRSVMAGDIIVYRAKGGAAGGSVFTKKDCLRKALEAVKTAELYDTIDEETGDQPVDINVSKLPEVKEWVEDVMEILATVGIEEIDMLRGDNDGANDEDNDDNLQVAISILEKEEKLSENTVSLLQEVLSSTNGNTGHIMFAAGPAEEGSKSHIWRVPVYHSTGVGPKSKRGIQRAYKRFEWSPKYERWTRGGPRDDVEGKHIEVVVGRMCV